MNIIIRATNQGAGAKGTADDLKKAKQEAQGFTTALTSAVAIVGGLALAAKKAFDFAKEGAQIELLETRFDRLAVSIGTTGEALEEDLGQATRGMLSRAELLAGAVDLMGLGLANSHDQAVRLAAVVSGLDMNLNQLTLTLTNKTTMRFDALGVRVEGFKEKLEALEEQGYSTDEAFKLAFLEQSEQQLELYGHTADTTAGQLSIMEAEVKDAWDSIKMWAADLAGPVATAFNDYIEVVDFLRDAKEKGIITEARFRLEVAKLNTILPTNGEWLRKIADQMKLMDSASPGRTMNVLWEELVRVNEAAPEAAESFAGLVDEMDRLKDLMAGKLGGAFDEFDEKQGTLIEKTQSLEDQIASLSEQNYLTAAQKQELDGLQTELEEVREQIKLNKEEHARATKSILFDMIQQRMAVDGLSAEEQKALSAIAADWGLIDETTKLAYDSFDELFEEIVSDGKIAVDELQEINSWAEEVAGDYDINFNISRHVFTTYSGQQQVSGNLDWLSGGVVEGGLSNMPGFASGADFIVPDRPQYANDGFGPLFFDAGERVIAIPKGQQGPAGGGGDTVVNVYLDGKLIERTVAKGLRKQGYNSRL